MRLDRNKSNRWLLRQRTPNLGDDQNVKCKVFSVLLERAGGLWRCNRVVTADIQEWDACRECPNFDNCCKFCIAKLLVESAIITE